MPLSRQEINELAKASLITTASVFLGPGGERAMIDAMKVKRASLSGLGNKPTPGEFTTAEKTGEQQAAEIMEQMNLTPEQYDYYAAMTDSPKRAPTPTELRNGFLRTISSFAGGPDVKASVETIQSHAGYDNFSKRVIAAGLDPVALINERNRNIQHYKAGSFAGRTGNWMDKSGVGKLITYGTLLVAGAGAAGAFTGAGAGAGAGTGAGAGAGSGAGTTAATAGGATAKATGAVKAVTATGAKIIPIKAGAAGAAAASGTTAAAAAGGSSLLTGGLATGGGKLIEIATKAKEIAPKVVDGINTARTIKAVADGEIPPPPISIGGGSMADWATAIGEQYIAKEMSDIEKQMLAEQIRLLNGQAGTLTPSNTFFQPTNQVPYPIQQTMAQQKESNETLHTALMIGIPAALVIVVLATRDKRK